jgi:guanylate kinase
VKARVALVGPFGAGRSTLAKILASDTSRQVTYEIDQLITTRPRRPGEDDLEYTFVSPAEFDAARSDYLLVQPNRGVAWNYALQADRPLPENTIRLYVVLPEVAEFLRQLHPDETVICGVLPPSKPVLIERLKSRDPTISEQELQLRIARIDEETRLTNSVADVLFYNENNLQTSASALADLIESSIEDKE